MNIQTAEINFEQVNLASSDSELAILTEDQIALIGGGQCTTNSI